jgi:hypothetical protein|nr:hypothetical protein [Alteromonas macleodii]|tara:strand:+ start:292 stop:933 length:642 start_codon:yes stop_codon:yes gene_type:complete
MTTLILTCANVNEHYNDNPDYLVVDVNEALAARIQMLNMHVNELNVYCIEELLSDGTYCMEEDLFGAINDDGMGSLTEVQLEAHLDENGYSDETSLNLNSRTLVVKDNTAHFTAIPKHCDADVLVKTASFPIDAIIEGNPYDALKTALSSKEWGDACSILDEFFSKDLKQYCSYLGSILLFYWEQVRFTYDPTENWSFIDMEENRRLKKDCSI